MRLLGWVKIGVGAGTLLAVLAVVWATFVDDPGSDAEDPGGATAGEVVDPGGSGDEGGSGSGSGSVSGSDSGSGGPSGQLGGGGSDGGGDSSGSGGGDGTDGDADDSPGTPTMCGAEEFLGPLLEFVARLGDRNLLPPAISMAGTMNDYATAVDFPRGPLAPLAGVLSAPTSIISGYNRAYAPLSDFVREHCPGIMGDPHVSTIDGYRYSFQAVGEFQALRSFDGEIDIQVRLVSLGPNRTVSGVGGVAVGIDDRELVIESEVLLDGAVLTAGEVVATDEGGVIGYTEDGVFVVWPDGHTTATVTGVGTSVMGVYIALAAEYAGEVEGLLGDADEDPFDDLQTPDGPVTDTFEDIHGPLRDAWRLRDSMFGGSDTYDPDHPVGIAELTGAERREARVICVEAGVVSSSILEDCIVDVGATGDPGYAELHFESQRPRSVVRASTCRAEGESWTMGEGVTRNWSTAPMGVDGTLAWTATVDGDPIRVTAAAPFADGFVLVDRDHGLRVVSSAGTVLRSVELAPSGAAPAVVGSVVVVPTTEGLAAVDLGGEPCWHLVGHREVVSSLGVVDGVVLATMTGDAGGLATLLAMRLIDGAILWTLPTNPIVSVFGAKVPPAAGQGLVFAEGFGGQVVAVDLETGVEVWSDDPPRDDAVSGIALVDDVVIVSRRVHGVTALRAASGEPVWWNALSGGGSTVGMATDGVTVVLVDERQVTGVDVTDGATTWTVPREEGGASGQPMIAGDEVIVPAPSGLFLVLDLASGGEIRRVDAGTSGLPVVANGLVVLADGRSAVAYR